MKNIVLFAVTVIAGAIAFCADAASAGAAVAVAGTTAPVAGGPGGRGGAHANGGAHADHRGIARRIARRLRLTQDQRTQIAGLHRNAAVQIRALRANTSLPADQKRAQIRQIAANTKAQIQSALTPEQRQKLQRIRERFERNHGLSV